MQTDIPFDALEMFFRPRSVAVVGASPQRGTARNQILQVLAKHGFAGRVFPVSPSHAEIEGNLAYRSVGDIPEVPDLALIITPAATVPGVVAECGRKGIKSVIVFSSGFEEVESGREIARQLVDAARDHGVTVLGPNCQGLWSVTAKSVFSFGGAATSIDAIKHAPIAIISQSGALSGAMGAALQRRGVGCSYVVSVGNESCCDALDMLAWVIEQDDVKVVALYLEGLRDGWRLLPLADRARQRGIQIVVLKAGRSAFGQEATASHTGKIASSYAIYRDVLDQAGVLTVETLSEVLAAAEVFSMLPAPRASDDPLSGIAVLSSSGGAGALLADHSSELGLPMSVFSPRTSEDLERVLPAFARKANPIDLTGQIRSIPNLYANALAAVAADPRTRAIVIQFASSGRRDLAENGEVFRACARLHRLPVVISFAAEAVDPSVAEDFRKDGVLLTTDPFDAMRALGWIFDRSRWAQVQVAPRLQDGAQEDTPVSWEDTMSFLTRAGVPPAKWAILRPGETSETVCRDLQFPVVVKALPSEAEHKTELGLVKLKVGSWEEVDGLAEVFRHRMGHAAAGILVQEMISDGLEVVLSCLRKTDFGAVLSIGSGGTAIELYRDVAHLALPVTRDQVEEALRRLRLWSLLQGYRGASRMDVDALIYAAVSFGNAMLATPGLTEAEINPVIVRPEGLGVAAVDFLGSST